MKRVEGIYRQLQLIFTVAQERHMATSHAAMELAESRIRKIGRIKLIRVAEFGPASAHSQA
jgi:hypothetical protein